MGSLLQLPSFASWRQAVAMLPGSWVATVASLLLLLLPVACTSVNGDNKACEEGELGTSRPCFDPDNNACMVSITKMAGLGEMLTRGCCSLKDKNNLRPRCMEGKTMKTKYGSVRETNCLQENCNTGSLEEEGAAQRQQL